MVTIKVVTTILKVVTTEEARKLVRPLLTFCDGGLKHIYFLLTLKSIINSLSKSACEYKLILAIDVQVAWTSMLLVNHLPTNKRLVLILFLIPNK